MKRLAWCLMAMFALGSAGLRADTGLYLGDPGEWVAWTWKESIAPDELLTVDLVRATVIIDRGRVTGVRIVPDFSSSGTVPIAIDVSRSSGETRIIDRYPARLSIAPPECLPPVDEHGDFWSYQARLTVMISVARGQKLKLRLMDGDIAAPPDRSLDLITRSGKVVRK